MPYTVPHATKTAMIRARTEPKIKKEAEQVLAFLGLNPSEAIHLFYKQITLQKGLPFKVKMPNKKTQQVLKDTDVKKHLKRAKNAQDLFDQLEI